MITVENIDKQGRTSMNIESFLLKKRKIYLEGTITNELAMNIIKQIEYLNEISNDDIYLIINSEGGSVSAGLAIYDVMQQSQADIVTIGMGLAASMGSFLLAAGTKGKRCAYPHCEIMVHQVIAGMQGGMEDLTINFHRIQQTNEMLTELFAKNTGNTIEEMKKINHQDNYLDAKEALEIGIIDKIL